MNVSRQSYGFGIVKWINALTLRDQNVRLYLHISTSDENMPLNQILRISFTEQMLFFIERVFSSPSVHEILHLPLFPFVLSYLFS